MSGTLKEFHFTDKPYTVLANIIEDQIVNRPTNP
jgi:hypothetical protein